MGSKQLNLIINDQLPHFFTAALPISLIARLFLFWGQRTRVWCVIACGKRFKCCLVRPSFNTSKAIFNLAIVEHGLDMRCPVASIFMAELDVKKRLFIPTKNIRDPVEIHRFRHAFLARPRQVN